MKILDSLNSPLCIDALQVAEGQGWIGMTICPGKSRPDSMSGNWQRDLGIDLAVIRAWGASAVVTLLEDHEFAEVGVEKLPDQVRAQGMAWVHLPIPDKCAPTAVFAEAWRLHGPSLHARLDRGERILVHCMGGVGRTGTVVAQLLLERGWRLEAAINEVRRVRQGAIETPEQEAYLRGLKAARA